MKRLIWFLPLSLGWLAFAYFCGRMIPDQQLWFALVATIVFGLPLYLAATYALTIQRIHRANQLRNIGIFYWFLNRRILPYIGWAFWAIIFAFLLLFYMGVARKFEWIVFILSIPVFLSIHSIFLPIATKEFKPYIALHKSLSWTRWSTAIGMAIFYVLYVKLSGEYPVYETLSEAIKERSLGVNGATNSVLIHEVIRVLGFVEGLKAYVLGSLNTLSVFVFLLFIFLGSIVFFYNIALAISSFMVPLSEYRRVFSPLQDTEEPEKIPPKTLAIASAVTSFFILFIYVPLTVYVDAWLHASPQVVSRFNEFTVKIEKIGDEYYQSGTIEQTRLAYLEVITELDISIVELRKTTDASFQLMAENVDDYLDWYYSLPGEYERIAALATGKLEAWMIEKLEAYLTQGNAFGPVQQSIEETLKKNEALHKEYQEKINTILAENHINTVGWRQEVIQSSSLDALKAPPSHSVVVDLENRLLVSGGTGAITAVIAGKITAKVIAKGAIQLGAKALVKVATGKAAGILGGAGAGAATGAAVGSVVPGVGTAIGATIGGIIGGISVGLGVEQLLLKLEEHYSRDEFKQQILEAIEESRLEFVESLASKDNLLGMNQP
ncbi:MAG: hypothetical protein MRK00_12415 [Nitrosomonas sp.]|nr:hypothetical protein [Nitrosomonas sp.]